MLADEVHAPGRADDAHLSGGHEPQISAPDRDRAMGVGRDQGVKNSLIAGAVAAAPGNSEIPSASSVSRSVLWC